MSGIAQEIRRLKNEIPQGVRLVAVSKFHPADAIQEAYDAGQRLFGESRVQELLEKISRLPNDIQWHFIGHLQTNKVRSLIGKISLIESVDSERLLALIDSESEKAGVITDILLQIHVAREETKFGFSPEEYRTFFENESYIHYKAVKIRGVMGMASNTDDEDRIRSDFRRIYELFDSIAADKNYNLPDFNIVSMGMSGDWPVAVEEGSNMIRIGSRIFGSRAY